MWGKFKKGDLVKRDNDPLFSGIGIVLESYKSKYEKYGYWVKVYWQDKQRATPQFEHDLVALKQENENGKQHD